MLVLPGTTYQIAEHMSCPANFIQLEGQRIEDQNLYTVER